MWAGTRRGTTDPLRSLVIQLGRWCRRETPATCPSAVRFGALFVGAQEPMPLTLEVDESDFGWCSVPDVVVVEAFSGEFASAGAFGDARVGAESSDRIRTLEDLGEGVPNVRG